MGRNDAEAPIFWPPDTKSQLIGKDWEILRKYWEILGKTEGKRRRQQRITQGGWHH